MLTVLRRGMAREKQRVPEQRTNYRPKGDPLDVNVHDFKDKELGKVVPHGIYDPTTNAGLVSVGITHDTAEFAVQSIRTWLDRIGRPRYTSMRELMITVDCGGSNSARSWSLPLEAPSWPFGPPAGGVRRGCATSFSLGVVLIRWRLAIVALHLGT
jgi:hypothetical protein